MISNKHILLVEAEGVLVQAGATSRDAARVLAPFRFVLGGRVLVQRAKLVELLGCLAQELESLDGC